ncbi:MAG: hypothetical protein EXR91_07235 [Gemmatimonadetes bacterium]|nr:hypothetical protein [Gemmatimonadota bacterium]
MTSDEYTTLMDFLATRFARMDAAFAAMDARLTRSEVLWESMRDDLRRVAEGVVAVNERLDRFQAETRARFDAHERRFDGMEARFDGMEVRFDGMEARFDSLERDLGGVHIRFDRFAVDFGTVQFDHGARIEALERQRRRRGPGG